MTFSLYSMCFCAEAPCLSFDVIADQLGSCREEFPLTCYLVGGTQASRAQANSVIVMKLTNLCKTQKSDDNEDDDDDERLILQMLHIYHLSLCVLADLRLPTILVIQIE